MILRLVNVVNENQSQLICERKHWCCETVNNKEYLQ